MKDAVEETCPPAVGWGWHRRESCDCKAVVLEGGESDYLAALGRATAASRRRTVNAQQSLFGDERGEEYPDYLTRQLITYIGNKRSLLGHIDRAVFWVKERLGKDETAHL